MSEKRVLIVYYSLSGQTQLLIQRLATGIRESGVEVIVLKLQPVQDIAFPFSSWKNMMSAMVLSFFRRRVPIQPVGNLVNNFWDLVVLAGPTWSYNPSGPVLSFMDSYGKKLTAKATAVLPLISCRSYWRFHYWGLQRILKNNGGVVLEPIVYQHSAREPWRTMGLFLQLLGRLPRLETSWFRRRYPRYGHSREQYLDAVEQGRVIANRIREDNV